MALHIFNTMSRTKEKVRPIRDKHLSIYTCGPTVYSYPHIGNYRTYLTWDMVTRALTFLDYRVHHVMNITDVGHLTDDELLASDQGEDKMEKAAKRENRTVWEIASMYEEDFLAGLDALQIRRPDVLCRATDHIEDMITMIQELIAKGHAYETPSGVYYDISSFPDYGKLSRNTLEDLEDGASGRVEQISDKRNSHDFVLWVLGKEQSMMWDSPWGRGYPGWHIECSAMSRRFLGEWFDIHGGGMDNIFPHHECEIAQSVPLSTKKRPFAHTWIHTGHVTVDGQRMAKSKGNMYTLHDLRDRGISFRILRAHFLMSHYRSTMDFSFDGLLQAEKNLATFDRLLLMLQEQKGEGEVRTSFNVLLNNLLLGVMEALEDDFHTPEVMALLFGFTRELNTLADQGDLRGAEAAAAKEVLGLIDTVFGVIFPWEEREIPASVMDLFAQRNAAKAAKNWEEADRLRDLLGDQGFIVEDTKDGPRLLPQG